MGVRTLAEPALLERRPQLAALHAARLRVLDTGRGELVLVAGEAGSGKTALLRRFREDCDGVLWGACDPLFTPRPLGPFADLAGPVGELARTDGVRPYEIAAALVDGRPGTVLVCEDLHWADEATLDVLSLLGRRIGLAGLLLVLSYRDDEQHRPLRTLLGELRPGLRLATGPLSAAAVAELARDRDAAELHRVTGGNPFFVSEVVAAGGAEIPPTVRAAVLARAARLSDDAAEVLRAVSIAVPYAGLELLDALAPDGAAAVDECLAAGILHAVPAGGVGFRHELARRAVEESLGPLRRRDLHRRALGAEHDLARLAHHADAAGDPAAVLRYAPAAAVQAAATGAHREAAEQYARALRYAAGLPPAERAELLEARSHECYLTDQMDAAIETLAEAVALRRAIPDPAGAAVTLVLLSRRLWCAARGEEADATDAEADRLVAELPPGPEQALAFSNLSARALNDEHHDGTVDWGKRALDLAEQFGETPVVVHSLNDLGTIELLAGRREGWQALEHSLALAEEAGLEEHIGQAYIHLGWAANRTRAYDLLPVLERGIARCAELGLDSWRYYLLAHRARADLDLGRWDAAAEAAAQVRQQARSVPLLSILTATVVALVHARRGEESASLLAEAAGSAAGQRELQYLAPVAAARAEAAWLDGRPGDVEAATAETLELALDREAGCIVGELTWLRHLAGLPATADGAPAIADGAPASAGAASATADALPATAGAAPATAGGASGRPGGTDGASGPYGLQLGGDVRGAAEQWTALGCPYDAALALAGSDDEDDLREALTTFQRLGARPAAAVVGRRLRERGVRGLPRGPLPQTRDNPAGLTPREAEVLSVLASGASNADIAARLFLSERTVHHHVAAILRKLGVDSRGRAVSEAARLGIV